MLSEGSPASLMPSQILERPRAEGHIEQEELVEGQDE